LWDWPWFTKTPLCACGHINSTIWLM